MPCSGLHLMAGQLPRTFLRVWQGRECVALCLFELQTQEESGKFEGPMLVPLH